MVLSRFFKAIFGCPYVTPTFQEYAMYMAHAASFSSSNLSRQVGAVITKNNSIIATGSNDFPKAFGGTYWPIFNEKTFEICDVRNGRDNARYDHDQECIKPEYNKNEINKIKNYIETKLDDELNSILEVNSDEKLKNTIKMKLKNIVNDSGINDITEYTRSIHGEMDALMNCVRNGINTDKAIMYCTTHSCHNCARHILASGISKVVFIEPYPKSKALDIHNDSISYNESEEDKKLIFRPFIGVGPRQYRNLFSMNLSSGYDQNRKNNSWSENNATPRVKIFDKSYSDIAQEIVISNEYGD